MEHEVAATSFAELGNAHRLAIFRFLVRAGSQGASVGDVQRFLDIPASTLSHHLSRMVRVGLIRQEKTGRIITCFPVYERLEELIDYLREECCMGVADP